MEIPPIRAALAAKLAVLVGDHGGTSPYWVSAPIPPWLQVMGLDEIEYAVEGTPHDDSAATFIVQGFVGIADLEDSQDTLDRWVASSGSDSVRSVLEGRDADGEFLGGLAYDVTVERVSGPQLFNLPSLPGGSVLGAEWIVTVRTSG